ncbi:AMP-binding protein [Granulosicoccus sp. 3-233]|uniref:AMP-binding protein n=1 Tax=Granulosicoccus sp. 3-233 TaxID=3417969 RepID=UPI003D33A4CE
MTDSQAALPVAEQPGDRNVPLPAQSANYTPLSPLSFLSRSRDVYPDRIAIIHGERKLTWKQVHERCLAGAARLAALGIRTGDVVAVVAPNVPALFELHFSVPLCGGVLNAINTRLDADTIKHILEHGGAKVLFVDRDSTAVVNEALQSMDKAPRLFSIDDIEAQGAPIADIDYEQFIDPESSVQEQLPAMDSGFGWQLPADEWQSIALNYTSGTTGKPKGVVYHHRGAALNAMSNISGWHMGPHPVYLWTLPMFHCNGWCFPWSLAANAGTSVCLRTISAQTIYQAIDVHGVTHFCGAPIILNFIINAGAEHVRALRQPVHVMTAAAPPPPSVLSAVESLGFRITHTYGLTETYGPAVMCAWHPEWNDLPPDEQARLKSRQGVRYQMLDGLDVMDPDSMTPVPRDGKSIGEVMFRGNIVMRGYFRDADATAEAFRGGWFHSGDLAIIDPDGYLRILDRSKDIIISGGENISSIEIEDALYAHPAVLEVAVAARPDAHWGETPCAFVCLKQGETADEQQLIDWCRDRLAHFKCPRTIVFRELPKTSTGKIQKFRLREWANALE